ncbi:MAG TPA: 3-oxoacyl-[acyl-carrier-protein] synthase III C-terminal domain-containing protein [Peptococcaceae bacterium]|jgi:alkylresorcinol/alkylpyrone synthase|nr:type III polyketide synthase [Clostridia bacterium]HOB81837.1 3-oxoacyl-[acyl-carrier-protein] synthase III C-terminal domain-containing protein [Peptococcaceae bacterium]HPZ71228.1 3-oxoacyl-[acyl-carrier-protein] synthase III C-terminal domain-containing protein [Peptococcaceae bacterium]HQD53805.1 3-oxoacyl-[acyl-carrier-protein] synthase III C-terminal domain-containing protein [Peptococcaceae bacterium]
MPFIASVGTALPPYEVGQAESKNFARQLFQDSFGDVERLLKVFESTRIEKRHFCMPPEWFAEEHSWEEKNNLFIENAICLGAEAISACLRKQDLKAADIDVMVYVNSTGIATPSIDAYLANLLGMKADLVRMPLWGLGCAGGAAGLARGFDLALAHPHRKIIVCCIELCGLTFVFNDRSKANFIAASLFADGAAAALIIGDEVMMNNETMPQILSSASFTWPDTLEVMGWHVQNEGMMVIFSKDIPSLVLRYLRPQVENYARCQNLSLADISRYIVHPGGTKVMEAYEGALELAPDALDLVKEVLKNHGNMSSCTIFYILEKELERRHQPGEYGLMLALGPGFSCEQVMLKW